MQDLIKIFRLSKFELKTWLISFVCLCFSFVPLISYFIWGNHDWAPLINNTMLRHGLIEGRFSQYIFQQILLNGYILPIFSVLLGFICYSYAMIVLLKQFFKFEINQALDVLIICSVITFSYIIEILYFQFIVFSLLVWPLIVVLSLICIDRKSAVSKLISVLLLFLALGGYPAVINFFVVALVCKAIQDFNINNCSLVNIFKKNSLCILIVGIVLMAIKGVYYYLKSHSLMIDIYNSKEASLGQIFINIPEVIKQSVIAFTEPQPYFGILFLSITSLILILFIVCLLYKSKNASNMFINILFIIALIYVLKFSQGLVQVDEDNPLTKSDPMFSMVRLSFYAMPCFILFALFYLKQINIGNKNIIFVICLMLLSINICNNLLFSKVQVLGFKAENQYINRVIMRIYDNDNYDLRRSYSITQIGEASLRAKYYNLKPYEKFGYYTLNTPFTRYWVMAEYYNFYEVNPLIKSNSLLPLDNMPNKMFDFLSNDIKVWPNVNSMYIDDNFIINVLSKEGEMIMKKQFLNYMRNN